MAIGTEQPPRGMVRVEGIVMGIGLLVTVTEYLDNAV